MVYNDKLKREIPEGWEVRQLGNLCSFRNGINYTKDEVGESYSIVNVRNISATSIILDTEDFDVITIPSSKVVVQEPHGYYKFPIIHCSAALSFAVLLLRVICEVI